jgi:hypothetical protein
MIFVNLQKIKDGGQQSDFLDELPKKERAKQSEVIFIKSKINFKQH